MEKYKKTSNNHQYQYKPAAFSAKYTERLRRQSYVSPYKQQRNLSGEQSSMSNQSLSASMHNR
jgi:hypothetical protein